jgi:hypothetical protein
LSGICLLLGVLETRAQDVTTNSITTNFWVQNINSAITAYVQSGGGSVISGTLPSKQLLTFLSGVTNLNNVLQTITNVTVTNLTVNVTDSPYLPSTNFPAEFDLTNYVLTEGSFPFYTSLTNGVNFTNDIVMTQTSTNPITYTLTNLVELTNGQTVYLFPNVLASSLTAVLVTNDNGSNVIFALSGIVTNTTTTPIFDVFPDFSKQKGAKLIYVTPIQRMTLTITDTNGVSVTTNLPPQPLPSLYMVRYSNGRTVTNVDVSNCFHEWQYTSPPVSAIASQLTVAQYSLAEIRFETTFEYYYGYPAQAGAKIDMVGYDFRTSGAIFSKGKVISSGLLKTRTLTGGGDGRVNGQIVNKTFNNASSVFKGSISFSVGHLESSL